jgi:hypothetical protein
VPKYKPLFNFDPPATDDEVHDAALQFVRKVSGTTKPSKCNELAFEHAVSSITACARELLDSLETSQPPRDREEVAAKARAISGPVRVRELRHAREISIKPQVAYLTAFGPKRTISSFQVDDRYAPTSGHGRPADRHRLPIRNLNQAAMHQKPIKRERVTFPTRQSGGESRRQ